LLTPEERVLKGSLWKEYTTPEGKKYYSNSKTKETVWEIPAELKGKQ
jgi:pre-mRNA-processing factor 40